MVCGKAFEQLQKIEDDLKSNPSRKAARDVVAKEVAASCAKNAKGDYIVSLVCSLVNCKVGRCRLTLLKAVLKAMLKAVLYRLVSALEARI